MPLPRSSPGGVGVGDGVGVRVGDGVGVGAGVELGVGVGVGVGCLACATGENAKQTTTSGTRKTASLDGDLPIDFIKRGVVRIIGFIFVEVELLNCINCNPVPRRTWNHPHEALRKRPRFG